MNSVQKNSEKSVRISAAIIAKNEADRIGSLLESLDFVDEIIVVDSGSSDDTISICQNYGAKVVSHEWMGYVRQKQFALEQCSGDWILSVDADESVSPDLKKEILERLRTVDSDIAGFFIPRLSKYLGRWIYHGGWYPDRKLRLVRFGKAAWVGDAIHEKLIAQGRTLLMNAPLFHFVYRDISDQLRTIDKFSSVVASSSSRKGSALYVALGVFHAIGKFLECAIWKRGLLDGVPGLIIAVNSSFYVFLKHAKIWEKNARFR